MEQFPQPEEGKKDQPNYHFEIGNYLAEVPLERATQSIQEQFPDFKINSIRSLEEEGGMANVVFLVNEDYIFRFARHGKADKSLATEIKVLPEIEKVVSLAVPHLECVGKQKDTNLNFVGYRAIEGIQLEPEIVRDVEGEIRPKFPERIGQFFKELHSFDVARARALGVPETSSKEMYELQLSEAREELFPELEARLSDAEEVKAWVEHIFKTFLGNPENFVYTPKLLHGDLEAEHIRYNVEKDDISGIIDFGALQIGDPDYDLWRPYSHYGPLFIEKMLETYPHPHPQLLRDKMDFFWNAQVVRRALRPFEIGDTEERRQWGIEYLHDRFLSQQEYVSSEDLEREGYIDWLKKWLKNYEEELGISEEELRSKKILEIGAYDRRFAAACVVSGVTEDVYSLEPALGSLEKEGFVPEQHREKLRTAIQKLPKEIQIKIQAHSVAGEAEHIPFADNSFDLAFGKSIPFISEEVLVLQLRELLRTAKEVRLFPVAQEQRSTYERVLDVLRKEGNFEVEFKRTVDEVMDMESGKEKVEYDVMILRRK